MQVSTELGGGNAILGPANARRRPKNGRNAPVGRRGEPADVRKGMVPPLRRKPSMKTSSFIEKRKAVLKVEDPEHFTIAQLKATLRAANVSEHDISLCIERSQLNTLYKERLDTEFKACVVVQRHWRRVLDSRRVRCPAWCACCVRGPLSKSTTFDGNVCQ